MSIGKRLFGRAGQPLTQVGLGGEGVLRTDGRTPEALAVIEEAADQGITYFDSARAYVGSEGYYGSFWAKHFDLRDKSFRPASLPAGIRKGPEQTWRTAWPPWA